MSSIIDTQSPASELGSQLAALRHEALDAKAASAGRGWGSNPGEISVFPGGRAVDLILDMLAAADAGDADTQAECRGFLAEISARPGTVTTDEIVAFCDRIAAEPV